MFKIGQRIVCKDASGRNSLIKGKIYTIDSFGFCSECGIKNVYLKEIKVYTQCLCNCGEISVGPASCHLYRFEPLKYDLISNKDVIKEIIEEKQDVEIKEPVKIDINQ